MSPITEIALVVIAIVIVVGIWSDEIVKIIKAIKGK